MRKVVPTVSTAIRLREAKGLRLVSPSRFAGNGFHGTVEVKGRLRVEVRMWKEDC